jgi:2-dehydro-3-deoxygluconokinase
VSSVTGAATAAGPEVVCLGESMVTFLPSRPGPLADVPSFIRAIGGAESNVACTLAAAGHRVKWVSRVGADGFGDHLVREIAGYGVDVTGVGRDARRPTGVYFRTATDRATAEHEVVYYRAGSAASAMSPATVPASAFTGARVLHLTGITAALSDDCLALVRTLAAPREGRPLLSFDVNHRPRLWRDPAGAGAVLLELARAADLVFVGDDEAEDAWGLKGAQAIREALPEPAVLVVKHGARGATVFAREQDAGPDRVPPFAGTAGGAGVNGTERHGGTTGVTGTTGTAGNTGTTGINGDNTRGEPAHDRAAGGRGPADGTGAGPRTGSAARNHHPAGGDGDTVVFEPAPSVDVVAPVGAGDAFAAGYLSATLRGLGLRARLRHGHLTAAAALTVPEDLGVPPVTGYADHLAALDPDAWGKLRLGPGWTSAADEEVRTT